MDVQQITTTIKIPDSSEKKGFAKILRPNQQKK